MPDLARVEEENNTANRASILNLEYVDTSNINKQINPDILSNDEMYSLKVVPVTFDPHHIKFGVTNTTSQKTMQYLSRRFLDQRISFCLISDNGYKEYMNLYDPPKKVVYHDIEINQNTSQEEIKSISDMLNQVNANDMLAYLVEQAHKLNASDIHVETQPNDVRIRFRIDGVLHPVAEIGRDKYRILVGAVASSGNISTSADEAQQGHITESVKMANGSEVKINVRLESTPTINGMDVVMRIFNMDESMFTLDRLGLSPAERAVVDDIIKRPSGLVLIVGPTGSGKTTTLYSILHSLSSTEKKIITIEDPVEYQFPGITQISVSSKTSTESNFAERLRAVLRLDPDIVMVGEIRDNDTARTALQAALTGHLVLATFHAASASAALTRLIEISDNNPLLISSTRLIMAQRLIRRLDDTTKQAYKPEGSELETVTKIISTLPPNLTKPDLSNLTLYKPGKSESNPFGFSGMLAIREQFLMSGEILKLMQTVTVYSSDQIETSAIKGGMLTMEQDGVLKAIAGQTSLSEVFRVIG
jgi:type II secretory ATPase GspE/PulE/Tfp pilus assembly ATPase PilB-like protein